MEKTFHLLAGHFIDGTGCSIKKQVLLSVRDGSILSLKELRPGDMEGFGISVIEAAFCGIPVLASDLEGLKDAIKDGEDGFLLESENAEAWVKKINELLADEKYRKEFGQKARQFIIDNYSWEIISKR